MASAATLPYVAPQSQGIGVLVPRLTSLGRPIQRSGDLNEPSQTSEFLTGVLKRAFDLLVAVPLALLTMPVVLVALLAVKLISPGPAFFTQEREGHRGRWIRVRKIRTMVPDAVTRLEHLLARDPQARAEWERYMKLKDDPRIIPYIGRFLRRTSIDELPQLWSVIRGEMSLVGPRPFTDYHLNAFSPEFRTLRRRVRPGLTGFWQVTVRSNGDLHAQEAADTYYVFNRSLKLDLWILFRTIPAVVLGRGAY